jgi:sugar lactone lactonase YvrE
MSVQPRRASALRPLALLLAAIVGACGGGDADVQTTADIEVADVGFATPESVAMDTVADVYLVSNVNGDPFAKDNNGFISRVTPDGQVEDLRWIDGAEAAFNLHAPKGIAVYGDSIYVADIDCIRIFHRVTGERATEVCVDGATFLNDVAFGPEGSLFVTDSGFREGFEASGTDAIFRLAVDESRRGATLSRSPDLGHPNGIAVGTRGIFVVTFGSGEVLRFTPSGDKTVVIPASDRQLDGIVFDNAGGFLYSSWGDSTVYHVGADGRTTAVVEGVDAPADIGFDPRRNRILVPLFNENRVLIRELPAG